MFKLLNPSLWQPREIFLSPPPYWQTPVNHIHDSSKNLPLPVQWHITEENHS